MIRALPVPLAAAAARSSGIAWQASRNGDRKLSAICCPGAVSEWFSTGPAERPRRPGSVRSSIRTCGGAIRWRRRRSGRLRRCARRRRRCRVRNGPARAGPEHVRPGYVPSLVVRDGWAIPRPTPRDPPVISALRRSVSSHMVTSAQNVPEGFDTHWKYWRELCTVGT